MKYTKAVKLSTRASRFFAFFTEWCKLVIFEKGELADKYIFTISKKHTFMWSLISNNEGVFI